MSGRPTVVVPIHNAADEVDVCLAALVRTVPPETPVLLIDDASEDPRISGLLGQWSGQAPGSWRFERQSKNLGFVATANRGMALAAGDVVLLNSDTIPTEGWLERLCRCFESDPDIATATPWTNNGEIASLPGFCEVNPVPPDPDRVARVIADTGAPTYPSLPTAVGFCMYIRRQAIEQVGLFDEARFGLGYGEENDFSLRVESAGWRNVLCDDAYVVHVGGRSFGPKGLRPGAESMQRLLERHPGYLKQVEAFIAADPLAPRRSALLRALRDAGVSLG